MWKSRDQGGCALSIETQAYCNHSCSVCPRNLDPTHSRFAANGEPLYDIMSTSLVEDLIRQAAEMGWKGPVHFSHYSEPLWDKRFIRFSKYAIKYGLVPELFTNGSLLSPELIKEIDGLIPYVVISFNSPGSQKYWASKFAKSTVRITKRYGVLIWNKDTSLIQPAISRVAEKPCTGPPLVAFRINYTGQMSMCYADFNNAFGLLNASSASLRDLWYGKEHTKAIKEMSQPGSRQHRALCRQCPEVFPDKGTSVEVKNRKPIPSEEFWQY